MRTVPIHEAGPRPSSLVADASIGGPLIIALAGKLLVKVVPEDSPLSATLRRASFSNGQISVHP